LAIRGEGGTVVIVHDRGIGGGQHFLLFLVAPVVENDGFGAVLRAANGFI
jgi:hypothetical protein